MNNLSIEDLAEVDKFFAICQKICKDNLLAQGSIPPFVSMLVKLDGQYNMIIMPKQITPGDKHALYELIFRTTQQIEKNLVAVCIGLEVAFKQYKDQPLDTHRSILNDSDSRDMIVFNLQTSERDNTRAHEVFYTDSTKKVVKEIQPFVMPDDAQMSMISNIFKTCFNEHKRKVDVQ